MQVPDSTPQEIKGQIPRGLLSDNGDEVTASFKIIPVRIGNDVIGGNQCEHVLALQRANPQMVFTWSDKEWRWSVKGSKFMSLRLSADDYNALVKRSVTEMCSPHGLIVRYIKAGLKHSGTQS